jgi:class 3 adenylate cyclase
MLSRPSLMGEATASPSDGTTRGFLFSDLRGYTHLVDTRGAVEASHLLARYRAIVREVVAHHGGAEIKTEGDSFYVVLPSASAALRCGLDIRKACTEPADGGEAIQLGVGIHAGESVAHEGGFVGSAINIAARICALATAGEVLVTGTIRELTRSIVPAEFVFVGRRQLKGLDQPVEVFSVAPDGAVSAVRRRSLRAAAAPHAWLAVVVVVIAAVGAGGAYALGWRPSSGLPGAGSSGGPVASSQPSANAPSGRIAQLPQDLRTLDPGTYVPNHNRIVASVTIPESGWKVAADTEDLLVFERSAASGGIVGVGVAHITVVYTAGCSTDPTQVIGDSPRELINWVQGAPQLDASELGAAIDLGRSGIGIEAAVLAPPAGSMCGPARAWLWGIAGGAWTPNAGTHIRFEALDDGARTITVVLYADNADDLLFVRGESRNLLDSIILRN